VSHEACRQSAEAAWGMPVEALGRRGRPKISATVSTSIHLSRIARTRSRSGPAAARSPWA
jgi:hypothetical protein